MGRSPARASSTSKAARWCSSRISPGPTVNVGGQGYDATAQFDGTTTVTGLNLNGNGAGTANLTVNGNTTINQAILDWDADATNTTTVGADGVLTLNVDQVDLSSNNFNSTIDNRGEINVNLTNPLDTWTMAGTLNMDAATGAVINAGNMIVTGEINVIDGSSAALAGTRGPGPSGTATARGNNMEFNGTVNIAAGTEFIIDGDTTFYNTDFTGDGNLVVTGGGLRFEGHTMLDMAGIDLTNVPISVEDGANATIGAQVISDFSGDLKLNGGSLTFIELLVILTGEGGTRARLQFDQPTVNEPILAVGGELVFGEADIEVLPYTTAHIEGVLTATSDSNISVGDGSVMIIAILRKWGGDIGGEGVLTVTDGLEVFDDTEFNISVDFGINSHIDIATDKTATFHDETSDLYDLTLGGGGATLETANPLTVRGRTDGDGTIAAITYPREPDVTNYGVFSPGFSPGVIHVECDYEQTDTGVYEAEIGGLVQGDEYDCLKITGTATLGGTLDVELIDGFMPEAGDAFDILDWSSLVGTFDDELLPALEGNLRWDIGDLYMSGELAVVASTPGDANKDGNVDVSDLGILATNYGASGCGWGQADFTGEGDVDVSDLGVLATNYGKTAFVASVPEPSTLTLLATCGLALVGLGVRWRKR